MLSVKDSIEQDLFNLRQEERKETRRVFNETILPKLRKANIEDYKYWLEGYIKQGGHITHSYGYSFYDADFYVVLEPIPVFKLYGALSINLIVPRGIKLPRNEDWGHNELYMIEDFKHTGVVPMYNDIHF